MSSKTSIQGYGIGVACFGIAVVFLVMMTLAIFMPGSSTLSNGAVVVGIGTIVSVVLLAVGLLYKH